MSGYEQWQLNDLRKRIERLEVEVAGGDRPDDGLPEWERELLRKADLADMIWQRDVAAKVRADRDEWREDAIRNGEDRNKWMARYDEMRRERNEWRAKHAALRADVVDYSDSFDAWSDVRADVGDILARDAAREPRQEGEGGRA